MLGNNILNKDIPADGCGRRHIGPGFNLIGDDAVIGAVQHIHPADFDDIGTGAADIGAHGIEKVGKVYNVGLFGNILQYGHTAGLHGGQHDIDGGADRNLVEVDVRPLQALGISVDETVFDADLGTQHL